MRILVLGVGNILLSDEGIGVRVIEALEQRYVMPEGVEVLDGGTAGMELLEAMANRTHLIKSRPISWGYLMSFPPCALPANSRITLPWWG